MCAELSDQHALLTARAWNHGLCKATGSTAAGGRLVISQPSLQLFGRNGPCLIFVFFLTFLHTPFICHVPPHTPSDVQLDLFEPRPRHKDRTVREGCPGDSLGEFGG